MVVSFSYLSLQEKLASEKRTRGTTMGDEDSVSCLKTLLVFLVLNSHDI